MVTRQSGKKSDKGYEAWIASTDGKAAVSHAVEQAKKAVATLQEMRRVDSESIHKPFTV